MKYYLPLLSLTLLTRTDLVSSVSDGLANTPPMGWSSWNTFFETNNEEKMKGIADAVVDLGLHEYG